MTQPYDETFFHALREGARRSAHRVLPIVFDLAKPASVVDVGCGDGTWLSVVANLGVTDTWGLDGDYVDRGTLQFPRERFQSVDLTRPFALQRRFDLAISLEVAEHLPSTSAAGFVQSLVGLADIVLFSAAIPFQGGVHHINERWQDYWASLFEANGYCALDAVRGGIWESEEVNWWYAQNTLLYAKREILDARPELMVEYQKTARGCLSIVHPKKYLATADLRLIPLRKILQALPAMVAAAARRTLNIPVPQRSGLKSG